MLLELIRAVSPFFLNHNRTKGIHNMETITTNEVQYVGFWKRVLAAITEVTLP
jgi:hypothetical protein